jgi:hypothetical protein
MLLTAESSAGGSPFNAIAIASLGNLPSMFSCSMRHLWVLEPGNIDVPLPQISSS